MTTEQEAPQQPRCTSFAFHAAYTLNMSHRERKRMQTALARMSRRPALIHKGGKP